MNCTESIVAYWNRTVGENWPPLTAARDAIVTGSTIEKAAERLAFCAYPGWIVCDGCRTETEAEMALILSAAMRQALDEETP